MTDFVPSAHRLLRRAPAWWRVGLAIFWLGFWQAGCGSQSAPSGANAETGQRAFEKYRCATCHRPGGVGQPLEGIADRMTRAEVRRWIADPKKIKPSTVMPKFPLTNEELEALTDYVMTLQ